jgi:hypothetical protein
MFQPKQSDLQFLFDSAGETILINDVEQRGIISNPPISEYEQRYLHTLERLNRGDIINYSNEKYLTISESVSKRGGKYKALIRHCNGIIEIPGETTRELIGYDSYGRPVYKDVVGEPIPLPSIVDNKSFSIQGDQLQVANNQIIVLIQDNEVTREKIVVNYEFPFEGNYKVVHRDFTKSGLIIITAEKVTG